jgi:hypothetical protein
MKPAPTQRFTRIQQLCSGVVCRLRSSQGQTKVCHTKQVVRATWHYIEKIHGVTQAKSVTASIPPTRF